MRNMIGFKDIEITAENPIKGSRGFSKALAKLFKKFLFLSIFSGLESREGT